MVLNRNQWTNDEFIQQSMNFNTIQWTLNLPPTTEKNYASKYNPMKDHCFSIKNNKTSMILNRIQWNTNDALLKSMPNICFLIQFNEFYIYIYIYMYMLFYSIQWFGKKSQYKSTKTK